MIDFIFTSEIILENARVRLEPLTTDHIPYLAPLIDAHPDLMKYSTLRIETGKDIADYVTHALQMKQAGDRYPFAIYDKGTDRYAGSTSFAFVSNKDGKVEIGFTWIGKEFQQTGINNAMKFVMLSYMFEQLNFARVELRADSRNIQSRKAMEKIGAVYEGMLRSQILMPDGYRRSSVYYSILSEEWPAVKKERFAAQLENL